MKSRFVSSEIRVRLGRRPVPARPSGYDHLRQAVSFLLLLDREETRVLFVKKKETPGYTWSGQVGMIGGMIESGDAHDLQTALREFEEELSLDRSSLDLFGDLGFFPSRGAKALLHVFVARWDGKGSPVPDRREIDFLVEVPFSTLRRLHEKIGPVDAGTVWGRSGPEYLVDDQERGVLRIWGVTARALHSLIEILGEGE
jgi:8-oxo-dGTP pyrophosphatase MutT (NUDIX family)